MKTELVRGVSLLLGGALLLSGCVGVPVKTELSDNSVESEVVASESARVSLENKATRMGGPTKVQLFVYQDDDASKVSKKTTKSRKGYIVEFALNKKQRAEQVPAKIQYLD